MNKAQLKEQREARKQYLKEMRRKATAVFMETGELASLVLTPIDLMDITLDYQGYTMTEVLEMAYRGYYRPSDSWYRVGRNRGDEYIMTYSDDSYYALLSVNEEEIEERYSLLDGN